MSGLPWWNKKNFFGICKSWISKHFAHNLCLNSNTWLQFQNQQHTCRHPCSIDETNYKREFKICSHFIRLWKNSDLHSECCWFENSSKPLNSMYSKLHYYFILILESMSKTGPNYIPYDGLSKSIIMSFQNFG